MSRDVPALSAGRGTERHSPEKERELITCYIRNFRWRECASTLSGKGKYHVSFSTSLEGMLDEHTLRKRKELLHAKTESLAAIRIHLSFDLDVPAFIPSESSPL